MNRLSEERQRLLVAHLAQGGTIRGATVLLQTNIPTVLRNMLWVGRACQEFHDAHARNLKCKFIECDELHSYIHAKDENLPDRLKGSPEAGEMWTYCGMATDSRFMITWLIGKHTPGDTQIFTDDLAFRIPGRVQIHSDQLGLYRPCFEKSFGKNADYATTRKTMEPTEKSPDGLFQQPKLLEARIRSEMGDPDLGAVTTNHMERQNATIRTWNRRYARRTLAFSKLRENAAAQLALHFFYYNFVHQQKSLEGITPAMAEGVTDRLWDITDIVRLVPTRQVKSAPHE